jgi:hypothetical protein
MVLHRPSEPAPLTRQLLLALEVEPRKPRLGPFDPNPGRARVELRRPRPSENESDWRNFSGSSARVVSAFRKNSLQTYNRADGRLFSTLWD